MFKEEIQSNRNLFKWIFANLLLWAVCWGYIDMTILASKNTRLKAPFNLTLFDFVKSSNYSAIGCGPDKFFCGSIWIKLLFFVGFALSQFSIGFLADIFGPFKILKKVLPIIMIASFSATLLTNIYLFFVAWFFLAFTCTSTFVLLISQILEQLDTKAQNWKWRLSVGCIFQMSWIFGRFLSHFLTYIYDDLVSVMSLLTLILMSIVLMLKKEIWSKEFTGRQKYPDSFKAFRKSGKQTSMNMVVLSMTFFALGYNYYGNMNDFERNVSDSVKLAQHNFLQTLLQLVAQIMTILICLAVRRKCLPLALIQFMLSLTYVTLFSFHPQINNDKEATTLLTTDNVTWIFTHLSIYLTTASFDLIWIVAPETFPKEFRNTCMGICSGATRLGAITGILLSELQVLNESYVLLTAGCFMLVSAYLILLLPDMTKYNLPNTPEDVMKVQFPDKKSNSSPV